MNLPLKTHGGKHYLAKKIVSLMPPHLHYVEPFAGGLAVLLAKSPDGVSEVVNDLDGQLTTFWRVLQEEELFARFLRWVQATPFSQIEWQQARDALRTAAAILKQDPASMVERAVRFFVCCRQSMSGRGNEFSPLTRNRTRNGMNEQAAAWRSAIDGLPEVHERLQRVVILQKPALEVLDSQDGPDTLFYLDPPYVPESRSDPRHYGPYDMTRAQHEELLEALHNRQGMVMISGYPSKLYEEHLGNWHRHEFRVPNNASSKKQKRRMTEVVWCNFAPGQQEAA